MPPTTSSTVVETRFPELRRRIAQLVPGSHASLIYETSEEQLASAVPYVKAGLARGERCVYIADDRTVEYITAALVAAGVRGDELGPGALAVLTKRDAYLRSGQFDPQAMIQFLRETTEQAVRDGFTGLCVTGEMTWALGPEPGCERLIEYEALLNDFIPGSRVVGLCQFNRTRMPAALIRDVLRTHPIVIVGYDAIEHNPYFEPSASVIGPVSDEQRVSWMIGTLRNLNAVEQADRQHAALIEQALVGAYIVEDGRFIYVNRRMAELSGYTKDELLALPSALDLADEADRAKAAEQIRLRVDEGKSVHYEVRCRRKDGTPFVVEVLSAPLEGQRGRLVGTALDITERKRADEALRRSERALNEAQRIAHVGNWTLDLTTNVLTWSDESFQIFEIDPKDFRASYQAFLDAIHPEDREAVNQAYTESVTNKVPYEIGHRLLLKDGRIKHVNERCETHYAPDGRPLRSVGTVQDVTERRSAELEKEQYLRFFMLSSDAMCIADPFGCFKKVNPALAQITGYAESELVSKPFLDFVVPEDRQRTADEMALQVSARSSMNFENRYSCKDGTTVTLSWNAYYDKKDGITYATARDITRQKQTEARLREGTRALEEAQRLANVGSWEWDAVANTIVWSDELYRIFGRARSLPTPNYEEHLDLYTEESAARLDAAVQRAMKDGTSYELELQLADTTNPRWLVARGEIVRDGAGRITGLHGTAQDVTERNRAERARRESDARFRRLFESNIVGVLFFDLNGEILEANDALLTITGYTADDVRTHQLRWSEITPPEYRDADAGAIKDLMAFGTCAAYEKEYVRKDGSRVPVVIGAATFPDWPSTGVAFVLDISGRKRAERALAQLNEELEARVEARTAQLEAANRELEAFSYSVSHDLRAPLRALQGFSSILLEEHLAQLPADAQRYVGLIRDNAGQMGRLIDDLLNLSRLGRQPLEAARVDMNRVVQEALDQLAPDRVTRQVELRVADLPPCQGDPVLLRQVVINLLSNALKFTRRRDHATIDVRPARELAGPGESVYLVKDNGVGFDMRYAGKLFGVFQRLHSASEYEGTGVGLAIVQRIVQRHGGRVWAEAAVDQGATFYFAIPDCPPETAEVETPTAR